MRTKQQKSILELHAENGKELHTFPVLSKVC